MTMLNNPQRQAGARLRGICRAAASCRHGGNEGQSLVEFALILPMLMLVLTFMFSIGMGMINEMQLVTAVSNATQQLSGARGVISDPCNWTQSAISSTLPSFTAANLTYTLTITNSTGGTVTYGPTTGAGFSCAAANTVLKADNQQATTTYPATLTVSYPYSWIPVLPLSGSSFKMLGNLSASQTVDIN